YQYIDNGAMRQLPVLFGAVEKLRHGMLSADALRSFLIIGAGFVALALYARRKIGVAVAVAVTGVLVLLDLFSVDKRYLSHESFCTPVLVAADPFEPTAADKEILADTSMNYRVMDIARFMMPDPSYHHKAIGGYHAAKLTRYQDLIDRHLSHFMQVGYNPELRDDSMAMALTGGDAEMAAVLQADLRVLDMLNARYIVNRDGSVSLNPNALGNAWMVDKVEYVGSADDEMAALSSIDPSVTAVADEKFRGVLGDNWQAKVPGDTIYETSYAPGRLTYHADTRNGGVAVFSEVYFPWGWNVTVDGQPTDLARVDYLLRAVRLPGGSHEIVMEFDPASLHVTDTIATVAVVIIYMTLAAAGFVAFKRRRNDCITADKKD
ncbi:MAG: YfhO family protein, partial [Muribaculaceae bacterium]|nr:YfhO family protein [Muribaculaceae bacterium]